MKLMNKLEAMKGKTYMVGYDCHVVNNYKIKGDKIILITDKDYFEFKKEDAKKELNDFLPVENEDNKLQVIEATQKSLPNLADIVVENINKIKENKSYIPQANAICKNVSTLIQMASLELKIKNFNRKV